MDRLLVRQRFEAGRVAHARYRQTIERLHLDSAITNYEAALNTLPLDHPDIADYNIALAEACILLAEYTGDAQHSRRAVELAQAAVALTPAQHPARALRLACLARSCHEVWNREREEEILHTARLNMDLALSLVEVGHPNRGSLLFYQGYFAEALANHAEGDQQLELASQSIELLEQALSLLPEQHEERPAALRALSSALVYFNDLAQPGDRRLQDAIDAGQDSVRLTPEHDFQRHRRLTCLAIAHYQRYRLQGVSSLALTDLHLAGRYCQEASGCVPQEHQGWRTHMLNCSALLVERYEVVGSLEDLDSAIANLRILISALPASHPHRSARLSYLGKALFKSFQNCGLPSLLDEAIDCHEQALQRSPSAEVWRYEQELGEALVERFKHQREPSAIDAGVAAFERARNGALSHQRHAVLVNLGNALAIRAAFRHQDEDLDRAIQCFQQVYDGGENVADPSRLAFAYGLAILRRSTDSLQLDDLNMASILFQEAITSAHAEHPSLAEYYSHLGMTQRLIYRVTGHASVLEHSINTLRTCLQRTRTHHPLSAAHRYQLALSIIDRYGATGAPRDLIEASGLLNVASKDEASFIMDRWNAARERSKLMHDNHTHLDNALESYRVAIQLLPRVAWLGLDEQIRYETAQQWIRLGNNAAACAITAGRLDLAVEFLENSRSVLWNQLYQLGHNHNGIRRFAPELADELDAVGRALESNMRNDVRMPDAPTDAQQAARARRQLAERAAKDAEQAARSRRRLAERWDQLMQRLRAIPGASSFLGWSSYNELRSSAASGPVIIINISHYRCDGLIITRYSDIQVFPLPNARIEPIESWARHLILVLSQSKDRAAFLFAELQVVQILEQLWRDIGEPLCQAVSPFLGVGGLRRVWLMPTGALASLPLHAAMSKGPMRIGIPDVMVSSYTPTLSALIRARERHNVPARRFRMLAIGSPNAPGHRPLPCWRLEKEVIRQFCPAGTVTVLEDEDATLDGVLGQLQGHNFLHICSHGEHDWQNPYRSHLALCDGPLTLGKIAQERFALADFAFLSACHTARVDPRAPDESVHLASGMHLAGFRSIIATMWGIADPDAPVAAGVVYAHLSRGGRLPDHTDAAEALHEAVQSLRRANVPVCRWAPFIHIGV